MKKALFAMTLAIISMMVATGNALAQAHIVHYDTDENGKIESKRPDFKNTVVAIDFNGITAVNAKNLFLKLGARDFNEAKNPCAIDQSVICVTVTLGAPMSMSSYGNSSGYGNSGGSSNQASFNGMLYPVNVTVDLIEHRKDGSSNTTPLGIATCLAPAGSSTEMISSYGSHGGGAFSAGETSGLNATLGNAVNKDITRLLDPSGFKRLLAMGAGSYAKWFPGADTEVARAFAKTTAIQ